MRFPATYLEFELAETVVVRISRDGRGAHEGNRGIRLSRFGPVHDASTGRTVPILYAGEDIWCALAETVFHDVPDNPAIGAIVHLRDLVDMRASYLTTPLLRLADLTDDALVRYGTSRDKVTGTSRHQYAETRLWAQDVWDRTRLNGLVWNSRRSPDRLSFMLFLRDPDESGDLAPDRCVNRYSLDCDQPLPLHSGGGLDLVAQAALDRNVTLDGGSPLP